MRTRYGLRCLQCCVALIVHVCRHIVGHARLAPHVHGPMDPPHTGTGTSSPAVVAVLLKCSGKVRHAPPPKHTLALLCTQAPDRIVSDVILEVQNGIGAINMWTCIRPGGPPPAYGYVPPPMMPYPQ